MTLQEANQGDLKAILEEINEGGENKVESNEAHIKDWLACQPHLPQNYDERIVRNFIRGCKHDLERTKRKLDMYFTVRAHTPELFTQRDPLGLGVQQAREVITVIPLPVLTPGGCRVTMHTIKPHDISQFHTTNIFKYILMMGDIRLVEETAIAGDIFVFDIAGQLSVSHLAKLAVPLLRKLLMCAQEAYPQRLKEIHIINAPTFVDRILTLFKSFMKEKMRNRFHVHTSSETLHKFLPANVLPSDYGGTSLSSETINDQWGKKLESYKTWFEQEETVKSDETKRVNQPVMSNQEMFGFEGTFRRLSID